MHPEEHKHIKIDKLNTGFAPKFSGADTRSRAVSILHQRAKKQHTIEKISDFGMHNT